LHNLVESGECLNHYLKPNTANNPADADAVDDIIAYHDRTKHHPERYARGPDGLDWATQPDPFRRFDGSPVLKLPLADRDDTPAAAILFGAGAAPPQPFTLDALGLFFELSMGLSARKEIPGMSWYLRINPSSGNLHPTEAYAVLPALEWLPGGAGVYHYAPLDHALEQRARRSQGAKPDAVGFCVGLTSITWREAWKYGERAFRYCQHDVGHALAALRYAAAALGWRVELLPEWDDAQLARLLGLDRTEDFADAERETPELLVRVMVNETAEPAPSPVADAPVEWFGRANQLSRSHVGWPVIDEAIAVSERKAPMADKSVVPACRVRPKVFYAALWPPPAPPACAHSSGQLIRQRRSAVDFDGVTSITREKFLAILDTTLPRASAPPFDAWPFPPRLHLVLFVHRVTGLEPGMYLWLRAPADAETLRHAFRDVPDWEVPADLAPTVPLRRLGRGDLRDFARTLSCQQDIAADGAFSLGMLARFEPVLRERGAAAWRELFWESGMIGQALYLAAEAAGVRGTGIGCYFDDVLHRALGLTGHDWQSLYHFTIGDPVEDLRLRTAPPYAHLEMGDGG
jgi:SagB-type dehydrogenase family enzyme